MNLSTLKWLLIMKLTTVLLVAVNLHVSATVFSQDIVLTEKNVSLGTVLQKIRLQSGYQLLYNADLLREMANPVTIEIKGASVEEALRQALKNQPFNYELSDRTILIRPKWSTIHPKPTFMVPVQVQVSGTITNESNIPITGATVTLKGTTHSTLTNERGEFTIDAAPDGVLEISYIGFISQEVSINNQLVINVQLSADQRALEEVVVVGYGTQKRKDLTGAVSSVSAEDFADMPVANVSQALSGRVAGLDIVSSGGDPGSESAILLRGTRSFTASNDPLIIVDGMPFYGTINDINPYDIKSVDVLKDASSTAIYGSRGSNGVIMITTKRGESGKPRFLIESYAGAQFRYGRMPYADATQYADWAREAFRASGGYPDPGVNPKYDDAVFDAIELETLKSGGPGLDYQDLLLQNGHQQKHQLSIMGGSEAVKYNFATNYFNEEGILPDDIFNRISMRTNLDFTLSPIITAGTSIQLNYSINSNKTDPRALTYYAVNGSPLGQVYNEDGSPRFALTTDGFEINPLADYLFDSYRYDNKRWDAFVNAYGEAKILPELTYRLSVGTNFRLATEKESAGYYSIMRNLGLPTANIDNAINNFKLYESILTYNKTFNEDHQLTVTGVHGFQATHTETSGAGVTDVPYEPSRYHNIGSANVVNEVSSSLSEWTLLSYAARIFYGYKSKYLLTLSMRADGASQFADNHKWGYFPSIAFAYNISEEPFMAGFQDWLSNLKLRLSYGVTGNQAINPYQTQGSLERTTYSWNENAGFGYRPAALANKNLKWESTAVYNVGVDFGLWAGRVSGNVEVYHTNTYDLLMFRKLPITSGYDQVLENVGSTTNKGFEVGLRTVNITRPDFKWNTNFTLYTNRSRITELYNGKIDDIGNGWFIGHPINVYYDYQKIGIWQLDEATDAASYGRVPGQIKVLDLNDDGNISAADRMILGDREPDFVANMTNQFSYKNWDFSVTAYIRWGGMTAVGAFAPYSKKRYNKFVFDYWTPDNPTNAYPRPNQLYEGGGLDGSTLTYRDATYITIPQVSLGYSIPRSALDQLHLSNARIYLSAMNLFYWTKSEVRKFNMKPDWAEDTLTYPAVRTVVAGVNIGF